MMDASQIAVLVKAMTLAPFLVQLGVLQTHLGCAEILYGHVQGHAPSTQQGAPSGRYQFSTHSIAGNAGPSRSLHWRPAPPSFRGLAGLGCSATSGWGVHEAALS
jgi:hypothetical protein